MGVVTKLEIYQKGFYLLDLQAVWKVHTEGRPLQYNSNVFKTKKDTSKSQF